MMSTKKLFSYISRHESFVAHYFVNVAIAFFILLLQWKHVVVVVVVAEVVEV